MSAILWTNAIFNTWWCLIFFDYESTCHCELLACIVVVFITFDGIIDTFPSRTLIQISQRSFYFILPPATPPSGESPESGVVPGLDSTNTTADGSHSPSTTPRQVVSSSHSRQTSPSPTRGRKRKGNGKGHGGKEGHALKTLKERGKQYAIGNDDEQPAPQPDESKPQEKTQLETMELEEGPLYSEPPPAHVFTPSSRSTSPDFDADPDYEPVAVKAEPMVDVLPTTAPMKRPRGRPPKRKRESSGEEFEARPPPAKKSKKGAAAGKTTTGKAKAGSSEPADRKDKEAKNVKPPAPSKKRAKTEKPKSLFTTAPAPPLSEMVAKEAAAGEASMKKGKGKGKSKVKKEAEAEAEIKKEGGEEEATEKSLEKEEVKVPEGPPPQKPPFTFPLLCYKALQALGGKAPYRAITKWLEKEYPYFALATKEGKDGWEVHGI
jgi:hypothetical protein